MNTTAQPITVMILDREYQVACEPEERQSLLEAAHYLDEQMRQIRVNGRLMALERIAVMAALNMSAPLLKQNKSEELRKSQVDNRLQLLADKLDSALSTSMD